MIVYDVNVWNNKLVKDDNGYKESERVLNEFNVIVRQPVKILKSNMGLTTEMQSTGSAGVWDIPEMNLLVSTSFLEATGYFNCTEMDDTCNPNYNHNLNID